MNRLRFLKIFKYLKISLLVPFALLLLIHFVIKDRNQFFANIFNAFPIPFLIGVGLILSLLFIRQKKWFRGTIFVTLLLIANWFISYYGFKSVPVSADNNHVFFWNIDNSKFLPRQIIHEKIGAYNPEIIIFMETRKLGMTEIKYLKEQFSEYNFRTLRGYAMLATKGEIESIEFTKLKSKTKYNLVKTNINSKQRTILIPDIIVTRLFRNGWQDLKTVLDYSLSNNVDMIIGDFNTPYESMHFNGFKDNYKSFHDVSEGFAATWPKGLPLLELDQIWVTSDIETISLKKFFFKEFSNHDMLIGSFKFKD